jgi:hypothetical protein
LPITSSPPINCRIGHLRGPETPRVGASVAFLAFQQAALKLQRLLVFDGLVDAFSRIFDDDRLKMAPASRRDEPARWDRGSGRCTMRSLITMTASPGVLSSDPSLIRTSFQLDLPSVALQCLPRLALSRLAMHELDKITSATELRARQLMPRSLVDDKLADGDKA